MSRSIYPPPSPIQCVQLSLAHQRLHEGFQTYDKGGLEYKLRSESYVEWILPKCKSHQMLSSTFHHDTELTLYRTIQTEYIPDHSFIAGYPIIEMCDLAIDCFNSGCP